MVFSSPLFLFLFLPIVLTVYLLLPGIKARNYWLLPCQALYFMQGQIHFVFLLASTLVNYGFGLWIGRSRENATRKSAVAAAIFIMSAFWLFSRYADFVISLLNSLVHSVNVAPVPAPHISLPIGISFFTFHALSYIIDVYRQKWKAATHPKDVSLYIFFFPQLIAGPILRWNSIGPQLLQRTFDVRVFAAGTRRFTGGLAKKVLIANTLAVPADQIFSLPADELSPPTFWCWPE